MEEVEFQSTLSVRRATFYLSRFLERFNISIHALREESDSCCVAVCVLPNISIHALREESDFVARHRVKMHFVISIHALREESDLDFVAVDFETTHFNPRSP